MHIDECGVMLKCSLVLLKVSVPFFFILKNWLLIDASSKREVLSGGREGGRGLFGLLSQAVRQEGSVFCSEATVLGLFLGKSETKSRKAIAAGMWRGTGK